MNRAMRLSLFEGISLPNGGLALTHLCYADDVIFMGLWSKKNALNLKRILRCLYIVSGLKVNLSKSSVMGVNVVDERVGAMADLLGCKTGSIPFNFLGLPVGENMKRIKPWKQLIDKFANKLSSWKARLLSMGGRITLAKAVLENLPAYLLYLYKASLKVIKTLEGIRRDFVWGKNGSRNKMRWVAWSKVQASKRMGGLGLGDIKYLNWAFLFKWMWRIKSFPNQFWSKVIRAIHNIDNFEQELGFKAGKSGCWKDILSISKDMEKAGVTEAERLGISGGDMVQSSFSVADFRLALTEKLGRKVEVGGFNWNGWAPNKVLYFVWN
ncbi:hypothetical protein HanPI659440_Chr05g0195561 [Helianthus annuus]|nr:hypothetical protein HanPI659440_Chr05g0195561 [Helianthus annuus]